MRPKRWAGAAAVLCLALVLIGIRSLDASLVLYTASANLPTGPYLRSFEDVGPGKIVAFAVPEAARHYQAKRGNEVHPDFLFIKPIPSLASSSTADIWLQPRDMICEANRCRFGGGASGLPATGISWSPTTCPTASIVGTSGQSRRPTLSACIDRSFEVRNRGGEPHASG